MMPLADFAQAAIAREHLDAARQRLLPFDDILIPEHNGNHGDLDVFDYAATDRATAQQVSRTSYSCMLIRGMAKTDNHRAIG